MSQVVGKSCGLCGGRIATALQGRICGECGAPVHATCAGESTKSGRACPTCGVQHRAPPRPPDIARPRRQATPQQVRLYGGVLIAGGLFLVLGASGWLVNGIPAPWFGGFMILVGVSMLALPSFWRSRVGAAMDDGWTPTVPVRGGQTTARFEGVYEGPVFSSGVRPFPLMGEGHMTIGAHGIDVSGPGLVVRSMLTFILLVTVAFVLALVGVVLGLWLHPTWLLLLGGSVLAIAPLARKSTGEILEARIPWAKVRGFRVDRGGRSVRILITGARPRGEITFAPAGDAAALVAALEEGGLGGPGRMG